MNKLQWNFNRNSNIFIQENAFESVVCEMAAILSRPQWVNKVMHATYIDDLTGYTEHAHVYQIIDTATFIQTGTICEILYMLLRFAKWEC